MGSLSQSVYTASFKNTIFGCGFFTVGFKIGVTDACIIIGPKALYSPSPGQRPGEADTINSNSAQRANNSIGRWGMVGPLGRPYFF
jgi:hypothetical protein